MQVHLKIFMPVRLKTFRQVQKTFMQVRLKTHHTISENIFHSFFFPLILVFFVSLFLRSYVLLSHFISIVSFFALPHLVPW